MRIRGVRIGAQNFGDHLTRIGKLTLPHEGGRSQQSRILAPGVRLQDLVGAVQRRIELATRDLKLPQSAPRQEVIRPELDGFSELLASLVDVPAGSVRATQ